MKCGVWFWGQIKFACEIKILIFVFPGSGLMNLAHTAFYPLSWTKMGLK